MNKFVKWIVDQVQKWSVSAVEESQTARIRQLEAQIAELKSQPHRSQTSEREASKTLPANKRSRVAGKKGPEQTGDCHVTEDQLFELDPPKKPLRADCPTKAGTSSVTSWLKKLPSEVQSQALADYKAIEPLVKTWSEDKLGSLKSRRLLPVGPPSTVVCGYVKQGSCSSDRCGTPHGEVSSDV